MPKIDFNKIDDVVDFSPLPPGKYHCKVTEVEEASTQNGDEMWNVRFQVMGGEHMGRYIFDRLVFSSAAIKRVKLVCSRLGLDVSGELDLTPQMIIGRSCLLSVLNEEYEDGEGAKKMRNVVPFAGYEKAEKSAPAAPAADSDDEPF
ncbi:MAG: hypothetical protein KCHDKBKB_01069 [Elusimicrobia bacterium]|nr:hypothetical protein [Elusimicrobiota bacterium]